MIKMTRARSKRHLNLKVDTIIDESDNEIEISNLIQSDYQSSSPTKREDFNE